MRNPEYENRNKVYVSVRLLVDDNGKTIPTHILWKDGREFPIDKVLHSSRMASLKAGGVGIRYTIILSGQERYLFDEEGTWFVERG